MLGNQLSVVPEHVLRRKQKMKRREVIKDKLFIKTEQQLLQSMDNQNCMLRIKIPMMK